MDSTQTTNPLRGWSHRLTVGSLIGLLAYAVNYGIIWVFLLIDGTTWKETYNSVLVSHPMLKFRGQILYNAHFVGTRYDGDAGTTEIRNELTDASLQESITSTVPEAAYHIIPILVLVITGYLLYQYRTRPSSRVAAFKTGLEIMLGYLFLSIGGVLFFVLIGGFVRSRPDPLGAILLAGIVYPVLWGGTGAVIGYERYSD